jgi:hypothetical protein
MESTIIFSNSQFSAVRVWRPPTFMIPRAHLLENARRRFPRCAFGAPVPSKAVAVPFLAPQGRSGIESCQISGLIVHSRGQDRDPRSCQISGRPKASSCIAGGQGRAATATPGWRFV